MLSKIPGGYQYLCAASTQVCFPLKSGGELRFSMVDDDVSDDPEFWKHEDAIGIDLYDGALSGVGVTGPVIKTGQ